MRKLTTAALSAALAAGILLTPQMMNYTFAAEAAIAAQEEAVKAEASEEKGAVEKTALNADRTVTAEYDPATGIVTVKGEGEIDYDTWIDYKDNIGRTSFCLIHYVPDDEHPPLADSCVPAKGLVFEDGVRLPESCYDFFANVCASITLPKDLDTSHVTTMYGMFYGATGELPDVSGWDVSNVTDMGSMFREVKHTPAVASWNLENSEDLNSMFMDADADPDVSKWNVRGVRDMSAMFAGCTGNPDVSNWDVSRTKYFGSMFAGTANADPDVSRWDLSSAKSIGGIFAHTESANPDVSRWNVSKVERFGGAFEGARAANPDVSKWNVSSGVIFSEMFKDTSFNSDVSGWRLPNGSDFNGMFLNAENASPDTLNWKPAERVYGLGDMFDYSKVKHIDLRNWNAVFYNDDEEDQPLFTVEHLPALETLEFSSIPGEANLKEYPESPGGLKAVAAFRDQDIAKPYCVKTYDKAGNLVKTEYRKAHERYHYELSTHYRVEIGVERPSDGLVSENGRLYWYVNGAPIKSAWKTDNGKTYYFGAGGFAMKGLTRLGNEYYYFDMDSGVQLKDAWKVLGDKTYYFNQYGPAYKGLREIKGQYYYFNEKTAVQVKDSWKVLGDKTYYLNPYGPAYKGLRKIGAHWYYFDPVSAVQFKGGWKTVGKNTYYFNEYGPAYTGLRKIGGLYHGFSPDGVQYKNGWYKIGAKTYYFNKYGVMKGER